MNFSKEQVQGLAKKAYCPRCDLNKTIGAAASFYGGFRKLPLDWNNLTAPILLIYGENDQGVPASQGRELEKKLKELGKNVQLVVYPNATHAFFNDTRKEVYNAEAAGDAWRRTVELFRANVR